MRVVDVCDCIPGDSVYTDVPEFISAMFNGDLVLDGTGRRVYITIGQFSIIRLERDSTAAHSRLRLLHARKRVRRLRADDDPCTLFSRISFPVDEFFPPDTIDKSDCYRDVMGNTRNS